MTARHQGLLVLLVAAVAHLTYYRAMPALVFPDSLRYATLAENFPARLMNGNWDLVSVPGYPFFLWVCGHWIDTLDGLVLAQQLLAVITCVLVWLAMYRMCGARAALIGGVAVSLSPFRHYYAQSVLSESGAEFLLVAGVCLVVTNQSPLLRLAAGVALGVAVLTRANLLPTVALASCVSPNVSSDRSQWQIRRTAALLATVFGWLCAITPWVAFNARRGVDGLTGSAGYLFNEFANLHGIGDPIALPPESTPELERTLHRIAWERIRADPVGYGTAVLRTARTLVFFLPMYGDIAPRIPRSDVPSPNPSLPQFERTARVYGGTWRLALHRVASSVYKILLVIGWAGLVAGAAAALAARRIDLMLLAAAPIVGVLGLSMMVVNSARYAAPFEAFALGAGLPAVWHMCERVWRRSTAGRLLTRGA